MTNYIGKKVSEIEEYSAAMQLEELQKEVIQKGIPLRKRIEIPKHGSTISYEVISKPLFNSEGSIIGGKV